MSTQHKQYLQCEIIRLIFRKFCETEVQFWDLSQIIVELDTPPWGYGVDFEIMENKQIFS